MRVPPLDLVCAYYVCTHARSYRYIDKADIDGRERSTILLAVLQFVERRRRDGGKER